jgi:putative intracellular protease/amidase
MSQKILLVLTSHNALGNTGKDTGFYLPEVTHPEAVFARAGLEVEYVSPKGGRAPAIGLDLADLINKKFLENAEKVAKIKNTLHPSQIIPSYYDAIFYAGGHGTMWDFPENKELARITATIYDRGGVVGAVCHGAAGLMNIQLADGTYLVAGKKLACFTNEEEAAVGLTDIVPFLLESKLVARGAMVEKAANFQKKVVTSDRLVTGQNPASAAGVGEGMVKLLKKLSARVAV